MALRLEFIDNSSIALHNMRIANHQNSHQNNFMSYKTEILEQLVKAAVAVDGAPPKIYWHLIDKERIKPWNFWLCDEEKLIAFFAAYEFTEKTVEITGVVHPEYRRENLFKNFLNSFLRDNPGIGKVLLVGANAFSTERTMEKLGARCVDTEFELTLSLAVARIESSKIRESSLQLADQDDLSELLRIDLACFGGSAPENKANLEESLQDPQRRIYLFLAKDQVLGKIHLRFDGEKIWLSDIGILPEFQGQGLGTKMFQSLFALFQDHKNAEFYLNVHALNPQALALYERLGFVVKNEYCYYSL